MTPFDFELNGHDQIVPLGSFSETQYRDASREEVLLWQRLLKLNKVLDDARPDVVREILARISEGEGEIEISAHDFARLRSHAIDQIEIEEDSRWVRQRVLGWLKGYDASGRYVARQLKIAPRPPK